VDASKILLLFRGFTITKIFDAGNSGEYNIQKCLEIRHYGLASADPGNQIRHRKEVIPVIYVKCEKCDHAFSEEEAYEEPVKVYVHKGTVMCEGCLIKTGVSHGEAVSWATYIKSTEPHLA